MGMSPSLTVPICLCRLGWRWRNVARVIFLLVVAATWLPSSVCAEQVPEYDLKAAFLYNFAQFIEWPGGGDDFLRICVYGRDPFGPALDMLDGKTVREKRVKIIRVASADRARQCDVLFVGDLGRERLAALLSSLGEKSVLTVGEGVWQQGVVINFIIDNNHMSFEVNLDYAKKSRLLISSKLLRLAHVVRGTVSP